MTNELFGKKTFDKSDLFYGARWLELKKFKPVLI